MDSVQNELLDHFRIHKFEAVTDTPRWRTRETWNRIGEIGEGTFGVVYLEKSNAGNTRAVKEVRRRRGFDYAAELIALTRFSKPAYAEFFGQFLGWYEDGPNITFAMEYFQHGDLRKFLNGQNGFQEDETREIAWQLLSGLEVMHSDGFTHRDLKPENIFVAQKPPNWRVKIGDFGVSKRLQNEDSMLQTRVGTTYYAAPELLDMLDEDNEGSSRYTNAVDIWAIGVILYEVFTGGRPFRSTREQQNYCRGALSFPNDRLSARNLSNDSVSFLQALLAAKPAERVDVKTALDHSWFSVSQDNSLHLGTCSAEQSAAPWQPSIVEYAEVASSSTHMQSSSTLPRTRNSFGESATGDYVQHPPHVPRLTVDAKVPASAGRPSEKEFTPRAFTKHADTYQGFRPVETYERSQTNTPQHQVDCRIRSKQTKATNIDQDTQVDTTMKSQRFLGRRTQVQAPSNVKSTSVELARVRRGLRLLQGEESFAIGNIVLSNRGRVHRVDGCENWNSINSTHSPDRLVGDSMDHQPAATAWHSPALGALLRLKTTNNAIGASYSHAHTYTSSFSQHSNTPRLPPFDSRTQSEVDNERLRPRTKIEEEDSKRASEYEAQQLHEDEQDQWRQQGL